MKKLLAGVLTATVLLFPGTANASSTPAATAIANVRAVRAAAVEVAQTKGSQEAVAALRSAVQTVVADVKSVKADSNATKAQVAAARFEAAQTQATLAFLKGLAKGN